jgi:hypothetical protein
MLRAELGNELKLLSLNRRFTKKRTKAACNISIAFNRRRFSHILNQHFRLSSTLESSKIHITSPYDCCHIQPFMRRTISLITSKGYFFPFIGFMLTLIP